MPTAFTSVQKVKQLLGVTVTTADGQLNMLVDGANQAIENYLGRSIASGTCTETRDGTGTNTLAFANTPVTAVSAVEVGQPPATRRELVYGTDYLWTPSAVRLLYGVFPRGVMNVALSYTAGFSTIPADLAEKAARLAAWRFKEMDRLGQLSKGAGGETIQFDIVAWPKDVLDVLELYRARFAP